MEVAGLRLGDIMARPTPSTETHYVATMMAYLALQSFAINLAQYAPGAETRDDMPVQAMIERAIETAAMDHEVTDLPAGSYDIDKAREISLDMLARTFGLVREATKE